MIRLAPNRFPAVVGRDSLLVAGRWPGRRQRRVLLALLVLAGCEPGGQAGPAVPAIADSGPRVHLVQLAAVSEDALRSTSVYTGSLRSRRSVRIFTQEEGRITDLPYYEGDAVRAGDVLLELDGRLLEAELDKAVATRGEAEVVLRRYERLRRQEMVSEDDFLRAQTAVQVAAAEERALRTRLGYTIIEAPFDGVVSARLAEPGDIVGRHSHVMTLIDPQSLVTDLPVSELLLPHLAIGAPVQVRIDALGDRQFAGRVSRIHPALDPGTRQGRVEIALEPVPDGARAGQFARVTFETEALDRKVVPFAALRRDREGEFVYRVGDGNVASRVAVRTGQRLAERVEIVEGLAAGDRIVVKGFLGLGDGMTVTPVDSGTRPGSLASSAADGADESTIR